MLPLVRRRLPAARLPFEDRRVIAAIGATLVATAAAARAGSPRSALREGVVQAIGVVPALVALQRPRPRRLPRGRAQGDRRLRAGHRRPRRGAQGARPLRLQPDRADDAALGRRHGPARAPGRAARARWPAPASASAAPRSRSRCSPGATATTARPLAEAFHTPGREIQRLTRDQGADPRAARGRGRRAGRDPPGRERATRAGRIDSRRRCSDGSTTSASPSRTSTPRSTLYEKSFEMELAHRETVESQGVEAVLLDVGDGPRRAAARRSAPTPPSASSSQRKGPGLHHVAYAVDDIDATLERARRRRDRADRQRGRGSGSATAASPSSTRARPAAS